MSVIKVELNITPYKISDDDAHLYQNDPGFQSNAYGQQRYILIYLYQFLLI